MNRLLLMILLFLIIPAGGARVGVVVEFPNGAIFEKCITVDEGTNAYEILRKSDLKTGWSYDSGFGHGLCSILDTGCPSSDCFCSNSYWNFYVKRINENSWKYSPVGFDAPGDCNNHYCARDKDLLGFTYSAYDERPAEFSFYDICPKQSSAYTAKKGPDIIGQVIASPERTAGTIIGFLVFMLLIAYFVYRPWRYF